MEQIRNIKDLKARKAQLKNEISDIESVLTFENPRKTLSIITNGFTDKYLKESDDDEDNTKLRLNMGNIAGTTFENTLKIGSAALVTQYAQKSLKHQSWKKKLIGLALIYVAPIVLKKVREELEVFQKRQTAKGLRKLI